MFDTLLQALQDNGPWIVFSALCLFITILAVRSRGKALKLVDTVLQARIDDGNRRANDFERAIRLVEQAKKIRNGNSNENQD